MEIPVIEHKLRVFISSKCGGKYTIARKALKKLLELTGLVETYVFEAETASSEDTQSAYLNFVDQSNLCIFLIDNKDGVPPAVLSEQRRAKEMKLRLLYFFCDEDEKEATPMQEEIKTSLSQKYKVVHEFSDIVSAAYDSVMQDVISVYMKKDEFFTGDKVIEDSKTKIINTETYSLLTPSFSKFSHVCREFTKKILPPEPNEEGEGTALEKLLSAQLQVVLFLKQYDETVIDGICNEVLKENVGEIGEILKWRYQAQKNYFCSKYSECISLLQHAILVAIKSHNIPTWLANDIAIDIRYVQERIDEQNNCITNNNPGQRYINNSREPVYFPYLDRQIYQMQEEIAKKYFSELNTSPYTIIYGGLNKIFLPLANAFSIAQIYGSIVQSEITRDRLISIYSMFCTLYDDHDFIVEYVRLLVTNGEGKKLDDVIRTHNLSIDVLNGNDIDAVLDSINNMFNPVHQMMSKYLLASRFGYYMNDTAYSELYEDLVTYAMEWIRDEKQIVKTSEYIFDFFEQNIYRAKIKDIIDFIDEVFRRGFGRYYRNCFKVLRNFDYSKIKKEEQNRVKQILIDITANENKQYVDPYYSSVIIQFCKTTDLSYGDLEDVIAEKYPKFYQDTFLLEMSTERKQELSEYFKSYLEEAREHNRTQGLHGGYTGYSYESLDVIYNILKIKKISLSTNLLENLVNVGIETLAADRQLVRTKRSAVNLLQFLYFQNHEQEKIWSEVSKQMINNRITFSVGDEKDFFSKDTNNILSFQYYLFINSFDQKYQETILEKLYSTDLSESYTIIQFLKIITVYLRNTKDQLQNETLVSAFLYYSIFMSQHKEQDVKYYAATCLTELIYFSNVRQLALIQLSQIMDFGSQKVKIAILSHLNHFHIDEENSYLEQIVKKGKSDNNFLVRLVASQMDCK